MGIAHMVMPLDRPLLLAAAVVLTSDWVAAATFQFETIQFDIVMAVVMIMRLVMAVAVSVIVRVVVVLGWLVSIKIPMGFAMAGSGSWAHPRQGNAIGLTGPGALGFTELAAFHQSLDMMMMAVLRGSHLLLETEHLGPVFAERAVHVGIAAQHLRHSLFEGVQHQGVIPQIGGFQKFHGRMIRRHQLGVLADTADQHA